jgi:hypothetical protein
MWVQVLIRVLEVRFPDEKAKALVNWSSPAGEEDVQKGLARDFFVTG